MRRNVSLCLLILLATAAVAQEGLSPKAGALSSNLYTNVYFGFNFQVPENWTVTWVAQNGPCGKDCMLLDVRAPGYPKPARMISVSAEQVDQGGAVVREAAAGMTLVSYGAKRMGDPVELSAGGARFFRTDYRSQLADRELLETMIVMPDKEYAAVFTFAAESRKALDAMVANFATAFSKIGAKQP